MPTKASLDKGQKVNNATWKQEPRSPKGSVWVGQKRNIKDPKHHAKNQGLTVGPLTSH